MPSFRSAFYLKTESTPSEYLRTIGFWCSILWAATMFSMWGIARYQSATLPGIGIGPDEIYNTFSHWASWVPLAQELSNGILLPVTPSLGIENQGLSYYPYISLWVHGVLLFFLGAENATLVGSIFFKKLYCEYF